MLYSDIIRSDIRCVYKTTKVRDTSYITVEYDLHKHKFIPLEILNTILEDKGDYELDKYKGICTLSITKEVTYNDLRIGRNIFECSINDIKSVFEKITIGKKSFYLSYTGSLYDENFNLLLGKVVTLDEIIKGTYNTQLLITSKVLNKSVNLFKQIRKYISNKNVLFCDDYQLKFYNKIHNLCDLNKSIMDNKEEFMNSIKNEFK